DPKINAMVRDLRSHGITRDAQRMEKNPGAWYYEMMALGFNYRITDIQAALGTSQMKRLDLFVKKRNELAKRYDELLRPLPLILPQIKNQISSFHLYVVRLNPALTHAN